MTATPPPAWMVRLDIAVLLRGGVRSFGSQSPDEIVAVAERYPVFRVS